MPYCCSVRGRSMYCYKCRIHRSSPCDSIPPSMMPLARLLGHAWLNEAVVSLICKGSKWFCSCNILIYYVKDLGGIQTAWRLQAKAYREHPEYWDDDAWRPATEVATNEVEATRAEATDVEATDAETTEPENPAPEMAVPEINELEALSAAEIMVLREIIKERTG